MKNTMRLSCSMFLCILCFLFPGCIRHEDGDIVTSAPMPAMTTTASSAVSYMKEYLKLEVENEDITSIQVFHWVVPAQAEKKTIADRDSIAKITQALSAMEFIGPGESAPLIAGDDCMAIELICRTGKITYIYGSNRVTSSNGLDKEITKIHPENLWNSLPETAESVTQAEIPTR